MGADTFMGKDVFNLGGDDLGDVKEIMLDTHGGRVTYAVLSFGGFPRDGRKAFRSAVERARIGYRQ